MTRNLLIFLAAGGSAAILLGAFGFQYIGGLAPCELCLWQRWPHGAAILVGAAGLAVGGALLPLLGAAAALTTAGIGVYHTGVERKWWQGPQGCSAGDGGLSGLSGADLLSMDGPVNVVMCDEVVWEMFTLSMASWNAILSLGFALLWLAAVRAGRRA